MSVSLNNHLLLETSGVTMEIYLNAGNEIFFGSVNEDDYLPFYFTINKEDWLEIKTFIDDQFAE